MTQPRVLVADDDGWILRMVESVLAKHGYAVDLANDGEEALEIALARKPDLLITDVMMPKVDGWTLVRALRARPAYAFVPVIFLTALNSDEDRIRGFRMGADDYMAKPFRFEELDLRVERVIKRARIAVDVTREQLAGNVPRPAPLASTGSGPHVALLGNLEQIGLSGLLTLLELERKSGILTLWNDLDPAAASAIARLSLRAGRVLAARLEGRPRPTALECFYSLFEWPVGRFEFRQGPVEVVDELGATTTHLLMEAARRLDERNNT